MIQETKKVKLKGTASQVRVAVEERSYFFVISLVALFDFFKTCVHLLLAYDRLKVDKPGNLSSGPILPSSATGFQFLRHQMRSWCISQKRGGDQSPREGFPRTLFSSPELLALDVYPFSTIIMFIQPLKSTGGDLGASLWRLGQVFITFSFT